MLTISACKPPGTMGKRKIGKDGVVESETNILKCTPPRKPFTKELTAKVKPAFDSLYNTPLTRLEFSLQTAVVKLTDLTPEGLEMDHILFRICEMSINRGFTNEQSTQLINAAIAAWKEKKVTVAPQRPVLIYKSFIPSRPATMAEMGSTNYRYKPNALYLTVVHYDLQSEIPVREVIADIDTIKVIRTELACFTGPTADVKLVHGPYGGNYRAVLYAPPLGEVVYKIWSEGPIEDALKRIKIGAL